MPRDNSISSQRYNDLEIIDLTFAPSDLSYQLPAQTEPKHAKKFLQTWGQEAVQRFSGISSSFIKRLYDQSLLDYSLDEVFPHLERARMQRKEQKTQRGSAKAKDWQPVDVVNAKKLLESSTSGETTASQIENTSTGLTDLRKKRGPDMDFISSEGKKRRAERQYQESEGSPKATEDKSSDYSGQGTMSNPIAVDNDEPTSDVCESSLHPPSPKSNSDTISTRPLFHLGQSDLQKLLRDSWLNDTIIHAIMQIIQQAIGKQSLLVIDPLVTADRLSHQVSDDIIILLPRLADQNHWILAIMDKAHGRIVLHDSDPCPERFARVKPELLACYRSLIDTEIQPSVYRTASMIQGDNNNCGVFMLLAALCFVTRVPEPAWIDPAYCRQVFLDILRPLDNSFEESRRLDYSIDWDSELLPDMSRVPEDQAIGADGLAFFLAHRQRSVWVLILILLLLLMTS